MDILKATKYKCSVSSVLNKDVKQFGKSFMFDGEEDTSWSSDQGQPQWITIQFEEPQTIERFRFQFQGGFAGNEGGVTIHGADGACLYDKAFYPEDINAVQMFPLDGRVEGATKVKFTFKSSTDFFGRIIVYKLELS
ncbi:unnamed protein product [Hermetia illucens]|uniref:F5/8 type C domain-containing protein n=1 Tax=Hermetia illucens TaxID=343691 RepID=A0A7R8YL23_HERIL|nr:nuclear receptor 2C2-associated protein [Hermetia illucens]CAD7076663.1 unnamed protein product [Hermetia illucens]